MISRIAFLFACVLGFTACEDAFTPVEPEPAEAALHIEGACNDPIDPIAHAELLDWARTHVDAPMQIEEGVVFVPEGWAVAESADARQMTTYALSSIDGLEVRLPGPGPRPGTYWDCQCSADNDSGCYWRHLGGLSYCKGSCGDTACRSKAVDIEVLEPGQILTP